MHSWKEMIDPTRYTSDQEMVRQLGVLDGINPRKPATHSALMSSLAKVVGKGWYETTVRLHPLCLPMSSQEEFELIAGLAEGSEMANGFELDQELRCFAFIYARAQEETRQRVDKCGVTEDMRLLLKQLRPPRLRMDAPTPALNSDLNLV